MEGARDSGAMSVLNIKVEQPDKTLTILRLSGEFEGNAALEGKEALHKFLESRSSGTLMLDLAGIEYIDSAALGILLEMSKKAVGSKIDFGLLHVQDPVKKVLEVTKLDKVLKIFE